MISALTLGESVYAPLLAGIVLVGAGIRLATMAAVPADAVSPVE
jgi:hypothetical protein